MTSLGPTVDLRTTRRRFLSLCLAAAGATVLPLPIRLRALEALAAGAFSFTAHERAVLLAAANTIAPAATVQTRGGRTLSVPAAGDAGAVDYIENLVSGSFLYAAGTQRPPYVTLPAGVVATPVPHAGASPLWAVKRIGWFGDAARPPVRPWAWPSELQRLQGVYRAGVLALDAAVAPLTFDAAQAAPLRETVLRSLQAQEVAAYDGRGEGNEPFVLTLLDHVAEACFGDPAYGGNRGWVYWDMIDFTGPSFVNLGGPAPGQGWTALQMTGPFQRDWQS